MKNCSRLLLHLFAALPGNESLALGKLLELTADQAAGGSLGFIHGNRVRDAVEGKVELHVVDPALDVFLEVVLAGQAIVDKLEDRGFALVIARAQYVDAGVKMKIARLFAAETHPANGQLGTRLRGHRQGRFETAQTGAERTRGDPAQLRT